MRFPLPGCCTLIRLVAVWAFVVPSAAHAIDHTKDSPTEVKRKIADNQAVLVDVREQSEWDEGHVAGAVHLPLSSLNGRLTAEQQSKLPKDKIIYLHCKSGRRCLTAGEFLSKQGYEVRCLKPGYADLVNGGFPKAGTDSNRP